MPPAKTYATVIADFAERHDCAPVDKVSRNPRCLDIARRFDKTPKQVAKDINRAYLASYAAPVTSDIVAYARVSTGSQSLDAQIETLRAAGAQQIYTEKASGAKTNRVEMWRMIDRLNEGDIVMVTRLDRFARSTRDLLNTLAAIGQAGAGFKSLGDPWADTTTPHGRLMLTVLGGLAEFERELIRSRTSEGRDRAMARGVKMGRKSKLTPHQKSEALKRRAAGDLVRDIARSYNVSHTTISRLAP